MYIKHFNNYNAIKNKKNLFWCFDFLQTFEGPAVRELPHGDDRARVAVGQVERRIQEHPRLRRQGQEHLKQGEPQMKLIVLVSLFEKQGDPQMKLIILVTLFEKQSDPQMKPDRWTLVENPGRGSGRF